MRALPAILVLAALVAGAVFIADRPGTVSLTWQGWRVDTSVAVLIFGVGLVAVVAAFLFHLLRKLLGAPRAFVRGRRERRRRRGYRALTQGMVAVAAGDAAEARRFAKQADVLLAEPPLTLLLSAQAAQLNGDQQAAQRYFSSMLERPETEFLGLRGLIMQAWKRNDEAEALRLALRARALRPKTPWVLASLVELQARAGEWRDAEASLVLAEKRHALPQPLSRHRHAAMLFEQSRAAKAEGRDRDAARYAAKANALAPDFTPAAVRYAELLAAGGHRRHARKVIEAAWRLAPHPDLAAAYEALFSDERPLERLRRLEALAAQNKDHLESHIALAVAALKARLWGEARRHLGAIGGNETNATPSPRICRLMAELEEAEHNDLPAARMWLARAATTAGLDPIYLCGACGGETGRWSALCPHCRSFDRIEWRLPGRAPAALPASAAEMMPALPVPGVIEPPAPPVPRSAAAPPGLAIDDAGPRL
jgi:HemY protein